MRNTPTIGSAENDRHTWHIANEARGFPTQTFCEQQFVWCDSFEAADYLARERFDDLNLCATCGELWAIREQPVTKADSMFNIATTRLSGDDNGFADWLSEEPVNA